MSRIVDILNTPITAFRETSALFLWSTLFLGQAWRANSNACEKAVLLAAHDALQILLTTHDSPEVRAACAYALGTYFSSSSSGDELSDRRIEKSKEAAAVLIRSLHDGSPLVRQEVLVALHHFLTLFTQSNTSTAATVASNVNRSGGNLLYKTIFDKVTEAIRTVASSDPSLEMSQLAETVITDLQQPLSTKFFPWCCSRFRVSNTINRDLGSGITQQHGAFCYEDEKDCFARSGRYWRNHCVRSNPSRLADFQHMRETIFTNRISNAVPLVVKLHPYENYLTVANSNSNLNFYEIDGTPRVVSTLKVIHPFVFLHILMMMSVLIISDRFDRFDNQYFGLYQCT